MLYKRNQNVKIDICGILSSNKSFRGGDLASLLAPQLSIETHLNIVLPSEKIITFENTEKSHDVNYKLENYS